MSDYNITLAVRNKVLVQVGGVRNLVCDNENYTLTLDLDGDWDAYRTKTVLFVLPGGAGTIPVLTEGNTCRIPVIRKPGTMRIGVTAGKELRTSREFEIVVLRSIRTISDDEAETIPPDLTQQIIERLDKVEEMIEAGGGTGGSPYAVLYAPQELGEDEQQTARDNIGAVGAEELVSAVGGAVTADSIQNALGYTPADEAELAGIGMTLDELNKVAGWRPVVYSSMLDGNTIAIEERMELLTAYPHLREVFLYGFAENKMLVAKVYPKTDMIPTLKAVGTLYTQNGDSMDDYTAESCVIYLAEEGDHVVGSIVAANTAISDAVVSGVEPTEDDIPKVFFGGALQQTKDEAVVPFRYISKSQDISGWAEIKAQGNSSMNYPKKNQTVKLFKDAECTEKLKVDFKGWGKQNKHVYKANWIDLSHARNVVSCRLWADCVKSREDFDSLPELYRTSPNMGAVDGFPVKVYAAGIYQGRYTLNIPKDKWTFNMDDELENHCVLCGENYKSGCFRAAAVINGSDWTDEIHDVVPASIKTRWNEVISFVMNSTDEEFKANLGDYFHVDSLIDYHLFGLQSCGLDAYGKNQIYITYDGQKWIACMYDMDSTWGLYWNGSKFVAADYPRTSYEDFVSTTATGEGNLLYIRLEQLFWEELQARWAELKNGALSIDNIINRFERFTDIAPAELVAEDYASTTGGGSFTGIPSKTTNNIQQIRAYALARQLWTDEYINALGEPEEPTVTLSSISATYTGGAVAVGTSVNSLTGIVVTATYSDGTSATVTGYTLTGEISEGSNTITVTYNGLTTTFAVTGYAAEPDEPEEPEGVLYKLPGATTFDGVDDYIDTGVQLFDEKKPFTVLVDWTHTTATFVNDKHCILHCMYEANGWQGLTLQYSTEGVNAVIKQTYQIKSDSGQDGIAKGDFSNFKIAFTRDEDRNMAIARRYNKTGDIFRNNANGTFFQINQNVLLGCYQTVDGTKGRFTPGIMNACEIRSYAMTNEEVDAWLMAD